MTGVAARSSVFLSGWADELEAAACSAGAGADFAFSACTAGPAGGVAALTDLAALLLAGVAVEDVVVDDDEGAAAPAAGLLAPPPPIEREIVEAFAGAAVPSLSLFRAAAAFGVPMLIVLAGPCCCWLTLGGVAEPLALALCVGPWFLCMI